MKHYTFKSIYFKISIIIQFLILLTPLYLYAAPISGSHTIGGGEYTTFGEAITDLINNGVDGAVTFTVEAGTYHEQISISSIPLQIIPLLLELKKV